MTAPGRSGWPIVVGGCHRSGTSLVRRILDSHPRIHCGPEVPFFRDFYGDYRDDPYAHLRFSAAARSLLEEADLVTVLGGALVSLHERAAAKADKPRWADKAPENVLYVKAWRQLLGERSLFVWVVRNPLDTLASMTNYPFPLTLPAATDGRIALYREMTEAVLASRELDGDRVRIVIYEKLVTDPWQTIGELMAWLGEEAEPLQLRFNSVAHQHGLEDPKVGETTAVHGKGVRSWRRDLDGEDAGKIWNETRDIWVRLDPNLAWIDLPGAA